MRTDAIANPQRARLMVIAAIPLTLRSFLLPQMRAARDAGFAVSAVCSSDEGLDQLRTEFPVDVVEIPRRVAPLTDTAALWKLWRLFRRRRPDVIHTHTPKAAFLGQVAAWLAHVPARINTVHGFYYVALRPGLRRLIFRWLEVTACRLATHVFFVSDEDRELAVAERWLPPERVELLNNGVDLKRFDPARFTPAERLAIRKSFGIPEGAVVIGIVARMVREKGFVELFEALRTVIRNVENVYLLHAGFVDRSRGDEVTPDLAASLGIADHCIFLGLRSDVPEVMAAMDVFCLPSYREGYPVSVVEACAMGLPCVVTDIRGSREAIEQGIQGLVVAPRTVEPLADALLRLAQDVGLRRRMGQAARAKAEAAFGEERVVSKVINRYQRIRSSDSMALS